MVSLKEFLGNRLVTPQPHHIPAPQHIPHGQQQPDPVARLNTAEPRGRGKPRKYDFGPVSNDEYRRLFRKQENKVAWQKAKAGLSGKAYLQLPPNLVEITPAPTIDDPELTALWASFVSANYALQQGIQQFVAWVTTEQEKLDALRATYVSTATKKLYG